MTIEEKADLIIRDIKNETGINPVRIFKRMAKKNILIFMARNITF